MRRNAPVRDGEHVRLLLPLVLSMRHRVQQVRLGAKGLVETSLTTTTATYRHYYYY